MGDKFESHASSETTMDRRDLSTKRGGKIYGEHPGEAGSQKEVRTKEMVRRESQDARVQRRSARVGEDATVRT